MTVSLCPLPLGLALFPGFASAQVPPAPEPTLTQAPAAPSAAEGEQPPPAEPATPTDAAHATFQAQLDAMRAQFAAATNGAVSAEEAAAMREEIDTLRLRLDNQEGRSVGNLTRIDNVKIRPAGYIDVGFFGVTGDGVSYARDEGNVLFPEHADVPWVFYGDPWATAINSQGDVADIGLDRTNIDRYDPIANKGVPSFIVNLVNQNVIASVGDELLMEASVNFEPRTGTLGTPGDFLSVDLAYVELVPFEELDLHLFAGKFEPVFGVEYRNRKASDRFTITPSIIARYLVESQTGIKLRGTFANEAISYNAAFTNGGASTERFGSHFFSETDLNADKTLSGRLSLAPALPIFLEVGASGQTGSQDNQPSDSIRHSQLGVDLKVRVGDFNLLTEWLIMSRADGGGMQEAPTLDASGWYAEAYYRVVPAFAPYARVDRRVADLLTGTNLYKTDTMRVTGGAHLDISFNVILKAEYIHIIELNAVELDDDLYTSSLVFRY